MRQLVVAIANDSIVALGVAFAIALGTSGRAVHAQSRGDFDGDGFGDLAIGAPGESVGGVADSGAVHVLYGSIAGPSSDGNQLWHQNIGPAGNSAEFGDDFGDAVAAGDFDGDGFDDLAVGARFEDVDSVVNAGAVTVIHGSASGLTGAGMQFWTQNVGTVRDEAETQDRFGWSLAAGDFNGDGFDDLAVGIPGEDAMAGAVAVLYGTPAGLTDLGDQVWRQGADGVMGTAEAGDEFGRALTASDFDGDGFDDLAIGVPFEDLSTFPDAGSVNVLYGGAAGLDATRDQFWNQNVGAVGDVAEELDRFGHSLASGDFDADGFRDLVIGVPYEDDGSIDGAGAVNVLYGTVAGLTDAGSQFWAQSTAGVPDDPAQVERFGAALAVGDFTGDGRDDLVIAVPCEDNCIGALQAMKGRPSGLVPERLLPARVEGGASMLAGFASSLGAGDFNGDGVDDLAVGVPFDSVHGVNAVGTVTVLAARKAFVTQFWSQDIPGIPGDIAPGDAFGTSLSHR